MLSTFRRDDKTYMSGIFPDKSLIVGEIRKNTNLYNPSKTADNLFNTLCSHMYRKTLLSVLDNLYPLSWNNWLGGGIYLLSFTKDFIKAPKRDTAVCEVNLFLIL